jgi:amino acid transporter
LESASVPASRGSAPEGSAPGEKGLKSNAIGFVSSVVIGVASTAPGYSLAAVLGFIIAVVGFQAPAILWVAFVPMLLIASAYYYMNRADPDCGTTFTWGAKALGPQMGWLGGWAIIVADIIVMANLASIAGIYTWDLFGVESFLGMDATTETGGATVLLGVAWIAVMTAIVTIGIELSARTQVVLLGAEVLTLAAFAAVALYKVYFDAPSGSVEPELSWFSPFAIDSTSAFTAGLLLAIFIYWGWDSAVTVNEETEDADIAPGRAGVVSTIILVGIYVLVGVAAVAFGGVEALADQDDVLAVLGQDVLGSPLDKLVVIAVLTSAAASTQTTILPTARTTLSMARQKAAPLLLGKVHPKYMTPHVSTILMGVFSIVWYVGLSIISENVLFDSIAALGLMIAFYYGLTGFACVVYYRREMFRSLRRFIFMGLFPLLGGLILSYVLVKSIIDLSDPANSESGDSWFGLGPPLVIGIFFLVLGLVLMALQWIRSPGFFRQKTETVPREIADKIQPPP